MSKIDRKKKKEKKHRLLPFIHSQKKVKIIHK
jgi:hypothetical protein